MRYLAALAGVALFAVAAGCGPSAYPSSPTAVSIPAAGTFDYYDDYPPPPDPYDPYPPPEPPAMPAPGTLVVTPDHGPIAGGTVVTISGSGFVPETTVMFGAVPATAVTVLDAATITAVTPASFDGGWVDVVVAVPEGGALTLPGGFTYADEAAPGQTATITITPAGNMPKAVVIAAGSRVRVVNNDARPHDLASDPHPSHTDCPEAAAGFLLPGATGHTGVFMTPRTCGIHDHNDPGTAAWMSKIIIR
jgi:hypothetical protein